MTDSFVSVITPLLLHMAVSGAVVFFAGGRMDTTACTALSALLVIPAAVWMYRKDCMKYGSRPTGQAQKQKGRARRIGFGAFCFAAGALLNILWSGILNRLRISDFFSNETQEALLAGQTAVQALGLGLLAPVAEELIFRGLLYRRMKRLMPLWAAALLSSAVFAVYHGNMIQIIFAFPMALALILAYERGQGIIDPILFHMGANLAAVLLNFV